MEKFEKKYKEALKQAKALYENANGMVLKKWVEQVFPELAESEDEKNIKDLIDELKCSLRAANCQNDACRGGHEKRIALLEWAIAWLEKLGEISTKSVHIADIPFGAKDSELFEETITIPDGCYADIDDDKVIIKRRGKSKFKVGDWITNGDYTWKIVEVKPLDYILQSQDGNIVDDTISHVDEQFHSFTIEDAKDGDVVVSKYKQPFIYNGNYDEYNVGAYCGIICDGSMFIETNSVCQWADNKKITPATKEQRDTLERAITNAGYRWDKEKLKLEKI